MNGLPRLVAMAAMIASVLTSTGSAQTSGWTQPVDVLFEHQKCVSYIARLSGDLLTVQATLYAPWHTFVMDNKQRAAEKLAGRPSIGIDLPTEIKLSQGLEAVGPWYQTSPKDFSQPEMRWYSWGYEDHALFAVKIRQTETGPAQIAIRGQVCTEKICRNVDVGISLPLPKVGAAAAAPDRDLKALVPVRK